MITLYILAGCVAVAAGLFIVMIVLTALRPPQLPEVTIAPPAPLQRVIRALTPVPIVAAQRNLQAVAVQPVHAPLPPVVPAPIAPRPVSLPQIPRVAPSPPAPRLQSQPRVDLDRSLRAIRRPIYPARRSRTLLRVFVGVLLTSVLAAGAVVAYPAMLDPLCDDFVWFGADTAHVVRQYAREAHAAIAELLATL